MLPNIVGIAGVIAAVIATVMTGYTQIRSQGVTDRLQRDLQTGNNLFLVRQSHQERYTNLSEKLETQMRMAIIYPIDENGLAAMVKELDIAHAEIMSILDGMSLFLSSDAYNHLSKSFGDLEEVVIGSATLRVQWQWSDECILEKWKPLWATKNLLMRQLQHELVSPTTPTPGTTTATPSRTLSPPATVTPTTPSKCDT